MDALDFCSWCCCGLDAELAVDCRSGVDGSISGETIPFEFNELMESDFSETADAAALVVRSLSLLMGKDDE